MLYRSLPEHLILFSTLINYVDVYFIKRCWSCWKLPQPLAYIMPLSTMKNFTTNSPQLLLFIFVFCLFFIYLSTFFMFTDCSCSRCPELGEELYKLRLSFLSISSVYSKYHSSYSCKLISYPDE